MEKQKKNLKNRNAEEVKNVGKFEKKMKKSKIFQEVQKC